MSSPNRRRLPEEIYVRRRIAAAVALVVVVALFIWVAVSCSGGAEDNSQPAFSSETNSWEAPAPRSEKSEKSDTKDSEAKDSESAEASTSGAEESETKTSDAEKSGKPSERAVAGNGKRTCELSDLKITAAVDRAGSGGSDQPTFYMTVANPTEADCEVDLKNQPLRFEVYDMATNARVWSDIDCNKPMEEGKTTFAAGKKRHFEAVWSRTTSEPGQCEARQAVPAGSYYLHGVVGDNPSAAQPFNLG